MHAILRAMNKLTKLIASTAAALHMREDSLMHFVVMGLVVCANNMAFQAVDLFAPRFASEHPVFIMSVLLSVTVAVMKEANDHQDNIMTSRLGLGPIHGVEWGDFLWGVAGGAVIACAGLAAGVM